MISPQDETLANIIQMCERALEPLPVASPFARDLRQIMVAIDALRSSPPTQRGETVTDEAVERLLGLIETAHEHGDECAIIEQAAKVRAALSTQRGDCNTVLEEAAKAADAYSRRHGQRVRETEGGCDLSSSIAWHAANIRDEIRALKSDSGDAPEGGQP